MSKKKIDWSLYSFDNPRKTGFSRSTAFWMENNVIKYMVYARWIWTKHNGEIPNKYEIHHIDGNKLNDDIGNLICVSSKDHGKLHRELNALKPQIPKHRIYGEKEEDYIIL